VLDWVYLIKFILTALPMFYLYFYKAPKSMCKNVTKILKNFLWW